MSAVDAAWTRLERWMRRHAPDSAGLLAPPADPGAIAAAQSELDLAFPDELVESLRRHDGLLGWANLLPGAIPMSVASIVEYRQMRMRFAAEDPDLLEAGGPGREPWWHPSWLPFGDLNGDAQVIDLRPGPRHGRLGWAVLVSGGEFDDAWPSLADYLTAVADALTSGTAVRGWRAHLTSDRQLWWDLADETHLDGEPLSPAPAW